MLNTFAMLASFWDKLTGDSTGITLMVLFIVGAAALVAVIVTLVLLSLRHTLLLDYGDKKEKFSVANYKAVDLPAPSREGAKFAGWFYDAQFTHAAESPFQMGKESVTLYAKWEQTPQEESVLKEDDRAQEEKDPETEEEMIAESAPQPEKEREETVFAEETLAESTEPAREEAVQEPAGAEGEPAAQIFEEDADEEAENDEEAGEGDEIDNALVTLVTGGKVFVQYRRSFRARLIQADDEMKGYYNLLRNELLSYVGIKERESWNYDSFNVGRRQFAKVNANTKSLILYLALEPESVDEKYRFRDVSEKRRYKNVPVRYKITGARSFKYALELIEQAAAKFELDFARYGEDLVIPYEDRETLIKKRLIKVYAKRETGETVTEEQLETYIAEGAKVEKLSAYTVTDQVNVGEAETLISDATAKQLIALAGERSERAAQGKRTYVNLDTISEHFREDETVDLASLKERGLVEKKAAAYKVLARGSLNKSLTIVANDFSLPAVKMIALTGGRVVKVRKE